MKYLGVDFGLRRIGLAISEGELASAWKVVEVRNLIDGIEKISKVIADEEFEKVIVGMPEGKLSKTVRGFIKRLEKKGIEVEKTEETLSSKNALRYMIDEGVPKEKRKVNDDIAAAIILQNWLDNIRVKSAK